MRGRDRDRERDSLPETFPCVLSRRIHVFRQKRPCVIHHAVHPVSAAVAATRSSTLEPTTSGVSARDPLNRSKQTEWDRLRQSHHADKPFLEHHQCPSWNVEVAGTGGDGLGSLKTGVSIRDRMGAMRARARGFLVSCDLLAKGGAAVAKFPASSSKII